ncbi:2'-5' RNA ligase family protein [Streptomyces sp. NBC_01433]|uniref:2'-5' RNA ligase family protein n=1 Tax=Streptomyces sp. NBC_01433 TaxID=2903864 RepID=UPI002251FA80|nr:2'-5' RNA ligase family protein [Streptomyces sp. NBC_01433]MCX4677616.1 2'-5' RNA ligase family protein [Streptomyces sp. NBC_01433]
MPPAPTSRAPASRKGICRAIFAVTGVVDEVADLIVPGAFAHTLATRPVKTVWHHEWKEPIGVVLEIAEWLPGDPRFASIPDWPAGAGALVATVQFNLRTSRGRDVYEQVRQWHEHDEAQFSIGYRVPPSGAAKRADGVRVIHKLDLYEVSPVLHGAHPMTRSLEVKADPGTAELEHKATASSGRLDVKGAEQQTGRGAMVALYVPAGIAGKIAHHDGTAPHDLHVTLAYLGDADQLPGHPDDLADIVAAVLNGASPLTGRIGGIGRFPDTGDGEPVFVPVDVPGLSELRERVVGTLARSPLSEALRTDHGFTPHITLGYGLPADTPAVPPLPVAFDTVHVVRGRDAIPIRLAGPAADDAPVPETGRARVEVKTARAAVLEAKAASSLFKGRSGSGSRSARITVLEAKSRVIPGATVSPIQPLPASYEEIRDRIDTAVRRLLAAEEGIWTCVEATYPGRVIVSVHQDGTGPVHYAVPYDSTGPEISLGTPQPVELTTVVIPEQGPARAADHSETADSRVVRPTLRALADATARIQAADDAEHLEPVRATVGELLAALSAKGLDVSPDEDDGREQPAAPPSPMAGSGIDLWDDDPYDEPHDPAPAPAPNPSGEPDGDEADKDTVRLSPAEVKARLAAIQG